jgi:thimet oligopeptidase
MNPYKAPLLLFVLAGAWLTSCATTAHDGYALAPSPSADPQPQAAAGPESGGLIGTEVARANAAIVAIVDLPDDQRTIANTLTAVDDVQWEFIQSVRMDGFLASVSTDAAVRDRGRRIQVETSAWFDQLYQNVDLYRTIDAFCASHPDLQGEDARYRDVLLRDFRRRGVDLGEEQRAELLEIENQLQELGIEFRSNIDEDETTVLLTAEECRGVPERALGRVQRKGPLYSVSLVGSAVSDFFAYCEVEETRCKLSLAYSKRAGSRNVEVLEELLRLRSRKARMLGYPTIAHYRTQTRMARTPERVAQFYADLKPKLRRKAERDLAELQAAKREHTGDPEAEFHAWDNSFYRNRLMLSKYAVDNEAVREYFPIERVTEGIFAVTQDLFGIRFTEISAEAREQGRPMWHAEVRLYQVHDAASGELLGEFYTDLHPRPGKYTHAAQFPLRSRKLLPDGSVAKPLVALVCNFTKPTAEEPALLRHREVETYFHEFGHCLHSILTTADYAEFAGSAVARDFVEAPSQMLENWIWDAGVLARLSRHHETGESLPEETLRGMLAAKNMGSGLSAEAQVFLGMMDMAFHTDVDGEVDTTAVRAQVYRDTRIFPAIEGLTSQGSFGHLVGYHASYYGYLWSLVYAQDMFSRFEKEGIMNKDTAGEYRRLVLARGGTVEALELVRDFLGREPNADAFLRELGLEE